MPAKCVYCGGQCCTPFLHLVLAMLLCTSHSCVSRFDLSTTESKAQALDVIEETDIEAGCSFVPRATVVPTATAPRHRAVAVNAMSAIAESS